MGKHGRWWIAGVLVLLAAAGTGLVARGALQGDGGSLFGAKDTPKPDPVLEFTPAEVVRPLRVAMPAVIELSGPLVAPDTAIVRARHAGTLLALAVGEGARVKAGQPLGRIDLADLGSRVAERGALVESARATLQQAERTHAQNERLAAQSFISPAALDGSRAAVQTARAQLAAAQAALATSRVAYNDGALVAPIGGIVAKRHAVPGEKLAPEQQVMTIVDLARLELAGSVGTHEVARLAPGAPVRVQVEGAAQPVEGRIARIAPAAEPGTRSIGVTIAVPNPGEQLRAGQYALAAVTIADPAPRLTLPAAAVGSASGQHHVWVIESGRLTRRAVTLGRRDDRSGRVEVLDGVGAAAQVLAARFDNLREGAPATVLAAGAPGVPSPSPVASASAPVVAR
jgi:RND family efflux transporter MFP subunit